MEITIDNVAVTNWSGSPLLKLNEKQKSKLRLAIMYSRQITSDALELLRQFERKRIVKDAGEAQIAKDYFGSQKASKEALEKYFGLDLSKAADRAKVGGIFQKFQQTDTGLSGAFEIVVGGIHDGDDVKVGVKDALSSLKMDHPKEARKHIKFIRTDILPSPFHAGWCNAIMDAVVVQALSCSRQRQGAINAAHSIERQMPSSRREPAQGRRVSA